MLKWSLQAEGDLDAIHDFIAENSPWNATRVIGRIIQRAEQLSIKPMRGHPVHEFPESGCVEVHESNYRIIYRCRDSSTEIVTVIHMRQMLNLDRLL